MKGWISPTDEFHECTLGSLPEELKALGFPVSDYMDADFDEYRKLYDADHKALLIGAGCIEVDEFHGLARFRGRGDRLTDAWHKLVELAGSRGLAIEKV